MSWSDQVFRYCERAADPAFWAEPFNALSNVAFLIVAAVALAKYARRRESVVGIRSSTPAADDVVLMLLIGLVAAIGVGSFLFHTLATRWARFADVAPIGLFMAAYLVFALRAFLALPWVIVGLGLVGFGVVNGMVAVFACPRSALDVIAYVREPCLNATMAYIPALATLLVVGALVQRRHPAGRQLLIAGGLFLAAILARSLDKAGCAATVLLGQPRGTHALWHLLVAGAVHVLLGAAITHRSVRGPTGAAAIPNGSRN
jgi:Ceramidase